MKQNKFTEIGFIRKASGYKGEVILALHSGDAAVFSSTRFFFIDMDGSVVPFLVEHFSDETGNAVVKFEDVNSHDSAALLCSRKVYLSTEDVPEIVAESDLDYLAGYDVIDKINGLLGTVKSVSEMPGQFIVAFEYKGAEILLPLHSETLIKILKRKKELHVILPEGLLDVYIKSHK
jgi:16S rRNA processing protein RimM